MKIPLIVSSLELLTCLLLFCVFTVTSSKIKMQTSQYRKSRIWEMKEDKYTKTFRHMRDIRKKVYTNL